MLDFITQLFERRQNDEAQTALSFSEQQLAAAALMMEVAAADQVLDAEELVALKNTITQCYNLSSAQAEELYALASEKQQNATSLHQFTQQVNDHCSPQEKFELIKSMWRVALADDNLDKYEENIIRRVSELIYLSHTDFLVARNAAREAG